VVELGRDARALHRAKSDLDREATREGDPLLLHDGFEPAEPGSPVLGDQRTLALLRRGRRLTALQRDELTPRIAELLQAVGEHEAPRVVGRRRVDGGKELVSRGRRVADLLERRVAGEASAALDGRALLCGHGAPFGELLHDGGVHLRRHAQLLRARGGARDEQLVAAQPDALHRLAALFDRASPGAHAREEARIVGPAHELVERGAHLEPVLPPEDVLEDGAEDLEIRGRAPPRALDPQVELLLLRRRSRHLDGRNDQALRQRADRLRERSVPRLAPHREQPLERRRPVPLLERRRGCAQARPDVDPGHRRALAQPGPHS
jgi:hypothetical protein